MYNLREYSDICSKTSGSLSQYYRDEPSLKNAGGITDFPANDNNIISFKSKEKMTQETDNNSTKNVEIRVLLKYLSNFEGTVEMSFIDCEINLILT